MKSGGAMMMAAVAAVAGLLAFYQLSHLASRGGESAPLYSVYRADPYGTAAFKDLLVESGTGAQIWLEPGLPQGKGGTLIQVLTLSKTEKGSHSVFEEEGKPTARGMARWVAEGNRLLVFSRGLPEEVEMMGMAAGKKKALGWMVKMEDSQRAGDPPEKIRGQAQVAQWDGSKNNIGKNLVLHEPLDLAEKDDPRATPLARVEDRLVAMELGYGMGKVVMVADPSPILNGWIDKGGDMEFVLGLLGDGPVYFDEWPHGMGRGGSVMGLMERFGLIPALLQALLVLGLYLWNGWGVEASEPPRESDKVSSDEQIDSLARLYGRTMSLPQARRRIGRELEVRAHDWLGTTAGGMERAMEMAPASKRERLEKIMKEAKALQSGQSAASKKDLAAALTMSCGLTREKKHG